MRIEEKTLILPALYIICRDGSVSTSDLIAELTAVFRPTGEDAVILADRSDTKFSQKVRNLKSHRSGNGMAVYTNLSSDGRYTLTPAGERYLSQHLDQITYLFSNRFETAALVEAIDAIETASAGGRNLYVYSEDETVSEGKATAVETVVRERSGKLRAAAVAHYRDSAGKLSCAVCGFCFEEKYGDLGKDYIEIHHTEPVYQYSDEGLESFLSDAVKKVLPLCANCHRMIHRNKKRPLTVDELKALLR